MSSHDISLPAEVENHPARKVWGSWATVGFGLVVIVVSFIIQMLVVIVLLLVKGLPQLDTSLGPPEFDEIMSTLMETFSANLGLFIALTVCVSAVICVGLIIIIVKARRSLTIAEYLGLRPITGKTILVLLAISVGFIVLSGVFDVIFERPGDSGLMGDAYNTSVWPVLFWIAIIIFGPVFEEAFFRGFLFEGFRQSRIGFIGAIVLTALGWALLHLQYGVYEITSIFVLGIILGVVRFKTRSLWGPLLMHAFNNLAAMIVLALNSNGLMS